MEQKLSGGLEVPPCGAQHEPLGPDSRTRALAQDRMSALGHQRTSGSRYGMSALPPKADMFSVKMNVCYVPIADLTVTMLFFVMLGVVSL